MGILVLMRDDKWVVQLREKWLMPKKSMLAFLEDGWDAKITKQKAEDSGETENFVVEMNNSELVFDSLDSCILKVQMLLGTKAKYGLVDVKGKEA